MSTDGNIFQRLLERMRRERDDPPGQQGQGIDAPPLGDIVSPEANPVLAQEAWAAAAARAPGESIVGLDTNAVLNLMADGKVGLGNLLGWLGTSLARGQDIQRETAMGAPDLMALLNEGTSEASEWFQSTGLGEMLADASATVILHTEDGRKALEVSDLINLILFWIPAARIAGRIATGATGPAGGIAGRATGAGGGPSRAGPFAPLPKINPDGALIEIATSTEKAFVGGMDDLARLPAQETVAGEQLAGGAARASNRFALEEIGGGGGAATAVAEAPAAIRAPLAPGQAVAARAEAAISPLGPLPPMPPGGGVGQIPIGIPPIDGPPRPGVLPPRPDDLPPRPGAEGMPVQMAPPVPGAEGMPPPVPFPSVPMPTAPQVPEVAPMPTLPQVPGAEGMPGMPVPVPGAEGMPQPTLPQALPTPTGVPQVPGDVVPTPTDVPPEVAPGEPGVETVVEPQPEVIEDPLPPSILQPVLENFPIGAQLPAPQLPNTQAINPVTGAPEPHFVTSTVPGGEIMPGFDLGPVTIARPIPDGKTNATSRPKTTLVIEGAPDEVEGQIQTFLQENPGMSVADREVLTEPLAEAVAVQTQLRQSGQMVGEEATFVSGGASAVTRVTLGVMPVTGETDRPVYIDAQNPLRYTYRPDSRGEDPMAEQFLAPSEANRLSNAARSRAVILRNRHPEQADRLNRFAEAMSPHINHNEVLRGLDRATNGTDMWPSQILEEAGFDSIRMEDVANGQVSWAAFDGANVHSAVPEGEADLLLRATDWIHAKYETRLYGKAAAGNSVDASERELQSFEPQVDTDLLTDPRLKPVHDFYQQAMGGYSLRAPSNVVPEMAMFGKVLTDDPGALPILEKFRMNRVADMRDHLTVEALIRASGLHDTRWSAAIEAIELGKPGVDTTIRVAMAAYNAGYDGIKWIRPGAGEISDWLVLRPGRRSPLDDSMKVGRTQIQAVRKMGRDVLNRAYQRSGNLFARAAESAFFDPQYLNNLRGDADEVRDRTILRSDRPTVGDARLYANTAGQVRVVEARQRMHDADAPVAPEPFIPEFRNMEWWFDGTRWHAPDSVTYGPEGEVAAFMPGRVLRVGEEPPEGAVTAGLVGHSRLRRTLERVDRVGPVAPERVEVWSLEEERSVEPYVEGSGIPDVVYHGTPGQELGSFLDEEGNLILRSAENFEGRQVAVSFSPFLDEAESYGGRVEGDPGASQAYTVFRIETASLPEGLRWQTEADIFGGPSEDDARTGHLIISRAYEDVVIPAGSFTVLQEVDEPKPFDPSTPPGRPYGPAVTGRQSVKGPYGVVRLVPRDPSGNILFEEISEMADALYQSFGREAYPYLQEHSLDARSFLESMTSLYNTLSNPDLRAGFIQTAGERLEELVADADRAQLGASEAGDYLGYMETEYAFHVANNEGVVSPEIIKDLAPILATAKNAFRRKDYTMVSDLAHHAEQLVVTYNEEYGRTRPESSKATHLSIDHSEADLNAMTNGWGYPARKLPPTVMGYFVPQQQEAYAEREEYEEKIILPSPGGPEPFPERAAMTGPEYKVLSPPGAGESMTDADWEEYAKQQEAKRGARKRHVANFGVHTGDPQLKPDALIVSGAGEAIYKVPRHGAKTGKAVVESEGEGKEELEPARLPPEPILDYQGLARLEKEIRRWIVRVREIEDDVDAPWKARARRSNGALYIKGNVLLFRNQIERYGQLLPVSKPPLSPLGARPYTRPLIERLPDLEWRVTNRGVEQVGRARRETIMTGDFQALPRFDPKELDRISWETKVLIATAYSLFTGDRAQGGYSPSQIAQSMEPYLRLAEVAASPDLILEVGVSPEVLPQVRYEALSHLGREVELLRQAMTVGSADLSRVREEQDLGGKEISLERRGLPGVTERDPETFLLPGEGDGLTMDDMMSDDYLSLYVNDVGARAIWFMQEFHDQKSALEAEGGRRRGTDPERRHVVLWVTSGVQTGVDEWALRIAKELGIPTGGTMPKGRIRSAFGLRDELDKEGKRISRAAPKIEDDLLRELGELENFDEDLSPLGVDPGESYRSRTQINAERAEGTLWWGNEDSRGYRLTSRLARDADRAFIANPSEEDFLRWLADNNVQTLNIAGNRLNASKEAVEEQELKKAGLRRLLRNTIVPVGAGPGLSPEALAREGLARSREGPSIRYSRAEEPEASSFLPQTTEEARSAPPYEMDSGVPDVLYHGTGGLSTDRFIDEEGNLTLIATQNFGGRQQGVSFDVNFEGAEGYGQRVKGDPTSSRFPTVFAVDSSALPQERLTFQQETEVEASGEESVVIPAGSFTILQSPEDAELLEHERERVSELPPSELGVELAEEALRDEMREYELGRDMPMGVHEGAVEGERLIGEEIERRMREGASIEEFVPDEAGFPTNPIFGPDDLRDWLAAMKARVGGIDPDDARDEEAEAAIEREREASEGLRAGEGLTEERKIELATELPPRETLTEREINWVNGPEYLRYYERYNRESPE